VAEVQAGVREHDNAMMSTLARVIAGFILACLTAGLVQVLFVMTPAQLLTSPSDVFAQRTSETGLLAALAATHAAIFALLFAPIAIIIGEWMGIRSLPYYLLAGATIAMLGFIAQFASEAPGQPTIFNNYALKAFLTSGFFAGLVYWLVAGHGGRRDRDQSSTDAGTFGVPPPKSWKNRPKILVQDGAKSATGDAKSGDVKGSKKPSLSERLSEKDGATVEVKPAQVKSAVAQQPQDKAAAVAAPGPTGSPTSVPSTKPAPAPAPGVKPAAETVNEPPKKS
jgi:hypothetical protein